MIEEPFRLAVLPLLEQGVVDVLEHSVELGWGRHVLPDWAEGLLDHYGAQGRLWGHGVTMSPFSVRAPNRESWLESVAKECQRRRYRGVSEHFGFMVAGELDGGAPLPVPPIEAAVAMGREALRRLAIAAGTDVGLENLALALGKADVEGQGALLTQVLEGIDGYLLLDLHNLYCQATNFGMDAAGLLEGYPLARVRCMHVSGGSWSEKQVQGQTRRFRRDTHDGDVPEEVHALLRHALTRCPALEVVVLERIGFTIDGSDDAARLRDDFMRVRSTVQEVCGDG